MQFDENDSPMTLWKVNDGTHRLAAEKKIRQDFEDKHEQLVAKLNFDTRQHEQVSIISIMLRHYVLDHDIVSFSRYAHIACWALIMNYNYWAH